jgi:exopolyphosphatase/guanosine-5'-triphosphate,3'-diphosphate pyrophosphatase
MSTGRVAAIDCGTNSTRLLVLDGSGTQLERAMQITRLGAGVDRTGRLDAQAIGRTLSVLGSYREQIERFGCDGVRAIATSATRDAANAEEFFALATDVLGVRPELLSGTEEGRLSFLGATADLDAGTGPYLVVDLGGGSTELVGEEGAAVVSLDVGCVRMTERFLSHDPPTAAELARASEEVERQLHQALRRVPRLEVLASCAKVVAVAGTVAALVLLERGSAVYDRSLVHHAVLRARTVTGLLGELAALSNDERRRRCAFEPGRADVIVGGAVVLDTVLRLLGRDELLASESDILDGCANDLLRRSSGEPWRPGGGDVRIAPIVTE